MFHDFLRMLDRYPYRVEVKGSSRELLAKRIFITCPLDPQETWVETERIGIEDIKQLLRRIENVWFFRSYGFIEVRKGPGTLTNLESRMLTH